MFSMIPISSSRDRTRGVNKIFIFSTINGIVITIIIMNYTMQFYSIPHLLSGSLLNFYVYMNIDSHSFMIADPIEYFRHTNFRPSIKSTTTSSRTYSCYDIFVLKVKYNKGRFLLKYSYILDSLHEYFGRTRFFTSLILFDLKILNVSNSFFFLMEY